MKKIDEICIECDARLDEDGGLLNMEWQEIDKDNLPKGEVLAANFKAGSYGYKEKLLGYLYKGDENYIIAESDNEQLENVTHYINLNNFDL